jgi:hypothetical protein
VKEFNRDGQDEQDKRIFDFQCLISDLIFEISKLKTEN